MIKVTATYENGVLKPVRPLNLREHKKVEIIIENEPWEKRFKELLKEIHSRTRHFPPEEIEKDITLAREEARKERYARRKSDS